MTGEKEMKEEEILRELAEFIPAISARQARRFDARANFSAERKRWERNTDQRGEESCSRVGQRDFNVISVIKKGSVSWRYLMKRIALKLRPPIHFNKRLLPFNVYLSDCRCRMQTILHLREPEYVYPNTFTKNITFIVTLKIMFASDDYGLESQAWNVSSIGVDSFGLPPKYFSSPITLLPRKHRWRSYHWSGHSYRPTVFQVLSSCPDEKRRDKLVRTKEKTRERDSLGKRESDCDQFAFSNRQKKRQSSFDETLRQVYRPRLVSVGLPSFTEMTMRDQSTECEWRGHSERARGIFAGIQNPRTNIEKQMSRFSYGDIIISIEVLKLHFNNNRIINLNISRSIWINRLSQCARALRVFCNNVSSQMLRCRGMFELKTERSGTIVADAEARAVQATGSIPPVYREGGTKRKIERERERERDLYEGGSKQRRLPLLVYARSEAEHMWHETGVPQYNGRNLCIIAHDVIAESTRVTRVTIFDEHVFPENVGPLRKRHITVQILQSFLVPIEIEYLIVGIKG
ncbi:hypothetical protein G5I_14051 [Acromyrmex echinatior]|uniref:Uncharacterized protein n=1 Tax=Acromyrmex echinatior TaxID=103372 RepID=F4X6T2_ACREC|nr:hypothetical protein G5I_14051 [Acromyrmex echinatior]